MRVVIADDSLFSRKSTRKTLGAFQGTIVDACTGSEAIAQCRAAHTDLLLLDLNMPGLDGYDVLEELKSEGIFTIVISANIQRKSKERAAGLGAKLFLNKPMSKAHGELIMSHLRQAPSAQPNIPPESDEQMDALSEVVNIASGQAVAALVDLLDVFVSMTTPQVSLFRDFVAQEDESSRYVVVRQGFMGELHGDAVLLYQWDSEDELARVIQPDDPQVTSRELLTEVSAILNGAFIGVLGKQLAVRLRYGSPQFVGDDLSVADLSFQKQVTPNSLTVSLAIRFEETSITVRLVLVVNEESRSAALEAIDRMLSNV
jgi:CheY-like chemotaxis protein